MHAGLAYNSFVLSAILPEQFLYCLYYCSIATLCYCVVIYRKRLFIYLLLVEQLFYYDQTIVINNIIIYIVINIYINIYILKNRSPAAT